MWFPPPGWLREEKADREFFEALAEWEGRSDPGQEDEEDEEEEDE